MVDLLVEDAGTRKSLHEDYLRKIPDLERISQKLSKKKANLQDLYKGYMGISEVHRMIRLFGDIEDDICGAGLFKENFLKYFESESSKISKYMKMIEQTIDEESLRDAGNIRIKVSYYISFNFTISNYSLRRPLLMTT